MKSPQGSLSDRDEGSRTGTIVRAVIQSPETERAMRQDGQLEILTLCGSIRERSYNAALIRALPALSPGGMVFVEAPLIVNIPHYDADLQQLSGPPASAAALVTAIREADGVIIVSPEYNYSVPGPLKNAIDWVSRVPKQPFAAKPS